MASTIKVPGEHLDSYTNMVMAEYAERFLATVFAPPKKDNTNLIQDYNTALHRNRDFQDLIKVGFKLSEQFYTCIIEYEAEIKRLKNTPIDEIGEILSCIKATAEEITKFKFHIKKVKEDITAYMAQNPMSSFELINFEEFMVYYRAVIA